MSRLNRFRDHLSFPRVRNAKRFPQMHPRFAIYLHDKANAKMGQQVSKMTKRNMTITKVCMRNLSRAATLLLFGKSTISSPSQMLSLMLLLLLHYPQGEKHPPLLQSYYYKIAVVSFKRRNKVEQIHQLPFLAGLLLLRDPSMFVAQFFIY